MVQVGARSTYVYSPFWGDPLWWRGGFGHPYGYGWRGAMWYGPGWAWAGHYDPPRYEHEVALLLRDRASGKPLFESRAGSEGFSSLDDRLLTAMFEATLLDFPRLGVNPRVVVVPLTPEAP